MRIYAMTFVFCLLLSGGKLFAQIYIGPQAGVDIGNIFLSGLVVNTENAFTPQGGLLITYLPANSKKPGVKMLFNSSSIAFDEVGEDYRIQYVNKGFDLDFLSHLYLRFGKFRPFVDLGTGIAYHDGRVEVDQVQSELPDFTETNINKVYLYLSGGAGLNIELGRIHFGLSGLFSYGMGNFYKNLSNFSSPYHTSISASIQVGLGQAD